MEQVVALAPYDLLAPDFGLVPTELVPQVWPEVEAILQEKGKRWLETVSEAEVFGWLTSGQCDLWLGCQGGKIDGFVIGCWEEHARAKRYCILYIAGAGLEKYIGKGLAKLEQYCCMFGGSEVVLEGRRGWARWLRRFGYSQTSVKLRKPTKVLWRN